MCGGGGSCQLKGFLLEENYTLVCLWRTYTCMGKFEGFQERGYRLPQWASCSLGMY